MTKNGRIEKTTQKLDSVQTKITGLINVFSEAVNDLRSMSVEITIMKENLGEAKTKERTQ